MKLLIVTAELLQQDERYTDDKGWAFRQAFERLGIETETFIYRKKGALSFVEKKKPVKELWRAYMNKKFLAHVKKFRPDMILLSRGETILPETLWKARKSSSALIVNVFTDNPLYMGNVAAIEPCHYFFVKDTYVLDSLRKVGLSNVHYLPQCTNPDVCSPVPLNPDEAAVFGADVSLIGSRYPYRERFVRELADIDLALWGRGWSGISDRQIAARVRGGDVRGRKKAQAISGSAISLNVHHPLNDIHGTNSRSFDIAACRGFMLADYKSDMDRLFVMEKEIVCFRSMAELREMLLYYLRNRHAREKIAQAAHNRVLRDHTYDNRAQEILEIVKSV